MHPYRTHNCGELSKTNIDEKVRLSGWVHRKRDHGGVVFVDLRDHYGITQCVVDISDKNFSSVEILRNETVVTITGKVRSRSIDTINKELSTGYIEVSILDLEILSNSSDLPLQVNSDEDTNEEIRLKYRFLDLRRSRPHNNIVLRSKIIQSIRNRMIEQGFLEFQTPILTASSPEGARDFLVPSRIHPGKFYALPQAPQQFKQLIMVSGFDKYFQIAPCFRDEDSRADRSPGEFYQLDLEMSFATQEDVFMSIEPVIYGVFKEFSCKDVDRNFVRIPYKDAIEDFGTDKPDLRFSLKIKDVTEYFKNSDFSIFSNAIEKGAIVRAIPGPNCGSRAIADKMNSWAQEQGAPGMGYIIFSDEGPKGPIAKLLGREKSEKIKTIFNLGNQDAVFFSCADELEASLLAGKARLKIGEDQNLINKNIFKFCWITDFPMYERDKDTKKIDFSHNPFSMPQGGIKALNDKDPLEILAWQYDLVCNGIELSSGAIRNHLPEVMYKAFEIAGYKKQDVDNKFSGMITAFQNGAPPHGGIAPGIDRIVMLIAEEPNIREITLFPMNGKAEDPMMGAPSNIDEKNLSDLKIKILIKNN